MGRILGLTHRLKSLSMIWNMSWSATSTVKSYWPCPSSANDPGSKEQASIRGTLPVPQARIPAAGNDVIGAFIVHSKAQDPCRQGTDSAGRAEDRSRPALAGCVIGTSWPKIGRFSPSVRFEEYLDPVRKIGRSLESSRGAIHALPPERARLRSAMTDLKRRMENAGGEEPALRIGEGSDYR